MLLLAITDAGQPPEIMDDAKFEAMLEQWARWVRQSSSRLGYSSRSNYVTLMERLQTGIIPSDQYSSTARAVVLGYDPIAEAVDAAIAKARNNFNIPMPGRPAGRGDRMFAALRLEYGAYDITLRRLKSRDTIAEYFGVSRRTVDGWLIEFKASIRESLNIGEYRAY